MSWRKTIQSAPQGGSWRDTVTSEEEKVSGLESTLRGAAQGASFGFADEIVGGVESLFTDKSYEQARDESRKNFAEAEAANPASYMAGDVGGSVASAFVPGLNVARGLTTAARLSKAATGGAVHGLGLSEADNATDMAKDTALGAGLGASFQGLGEKVVSPLISKAGSFTDKLAQAAANNSETAKRLVSKVASFTSGVDPDAALRQMTRPTQTAAAEADDFAFKIGQQAVDETDQMGRTLGANTSKAKNAFLDRAGSEQFQEAAVLKMKVEDFLRANQPSTRGFSAIGKNDREGLLELKQMLDGPMNGEDLVKIREHLDHVERLAGKYDKDGTGPVIGFLKNLRGTADNILDRAAPDVDNANRAFSQFKDDTSLLRGATNEGRAESMISNLYGANKGMQQEAAGRLFSPQVFDASKDIAANKAFEGAKRPGGDNYFRRNALPVLTLGSSELVTNPDTWKKGLRGMGRLEQAIKSDPQMFGKYANVLADAATRGPKALAATHFILSQKEAAYRDTYNKLDQEQDK